MTNKEAEEQITLYSPEYDAQDETISLNAVTDELLQTIGWKEQQKLLRIFDNKFLNVNEKNSGKTTSFNIKLTLLDAKPVHKRIINIRYLVISAILFAAAWVVYYFTRLQLSPFSNPYFYGLTAIMTALGAISFVYMVKQSRHVIIFLSRHGRIPVVELFFRNPDKSTFNVFLNRLIHCSNTLKESNYYTDSQTLAAELSEHRRLKNEGIISNEDYEQAKRRIFSSHSSS